ncbi:MAG TPA: TIGR04222 domain-containing membrane protein [Allosphingosinicella sp.]|jgi:uncharacterized protein (TIGR04222 family)
MSLGPFDLTGGPFLILYIAFFVATVVAGLVIPRRLRPEGRRQRVTDVDQLAFLAGGKRRFADALVSRLLAVRALAMNGKTFTIGARLPELSQAERSVLALSAPIKWRDIQGTLFPYAEPLERRMVAAGLLTSREENSNLRFWAMLPYAVLLMFGATKWVIGDLRERPIGYLTVLLVMTAVFALIRWLSIDRRTEAGRKALADAQETSLRIKRAPTEPEVGLAVALFGTVVLAGSGWSDFHKLRTAGDGGGSCGSSDGGGGGGCGGGGCGGCGG